MNSQVHRHPKNKIAIRMLLSIKKNNGKLHSDLGLDKDMLQLWVYTLMGMGYIRKEAQIYVITEKGEDKLHQHERKILVAA
ncbi:MAG: winged helix-turn-helix domain-containing protein [Nitrososphaera sp.]